MFSVCPSIRTCVLRCVHAQAFLTACRRPLVIIALAMRGHMTSRPVGMLYLLPLMFGRHVWPSYFTRDQ